MQKKDPNFKDMKEETVWSMEKFNDYFNEKIAPKAEVEQDWVKITMTVGIIDLNSSIKV